MEENKRSGMEELEIINRSYLRIKKTLENTKKLVEEKEKLLQEQEDELKLSEGIIVLGKRSNNIVRIEEAQKEKENAKKEIQKIQKELKEHREDIVELNSEMQGILNKLKENPELKQHIENCLATKYKREISKLVKEKKKLIKEQEKISKKVEKVEKLKELIKNHPHLKNNLTGMLQAKLEIKELKVKLSKLDRKDPANKNEIDKIQKQIKEKESKENKNKGLMIKYFTSNKIDISEKDIKELEETIVQKNGVVDINKTLDKNIKENNAKIEMYEKKVKNLDKRIRINEKSITSIQGVVIQQNIQPLENVAEPPIPIPEEPKLKWYQFIAKAKRLINNRRQKQEDRDYSPEAVSSRTENTQQRVIKESEQSENKNDFYNSLKYEVVKDMMGIVSKETMKSAKANIREETNAQAQNAEVGRNQSEEGR